jgi:hypothetical protein
VDEDMHMVMHLFSWFSTAHSHHFSEKRNSIPETLIPSMFYNDWTCGKIKQTKNAIVKWEKVLFCVK